MSTETLERRFAAIGARMKMEKGRGAGLIDVGEDRRGEFFVFRSQGRRDVSMEVVHADPYERCLLLLVREDGEKSKFLCGFDERHWFVAAIPEAARGVRDVRTAKVALQPPEVREAVARVRPKDPLERRNAAYVRQGEWFFLPRWNVPVDPRQVLRNEVLTRGRGKAHRLEFAFRTGGSVVYVNWAHPTGIDRAAFDALSDRQRRRGGWREMVRDPELYAKGAVRHPDHATLHLAGWHRVLMNTEQGARAMRHVAFLD